MIHEIRIPWLNADEEVVIVVEWLAEEGSTISRGDPLCVIETSKVVAEMEAEDTGILKHAVEAGTNVPVESVIGWIADSPEELKGLHRAEDAGKLETPTEKT
jgi:pyruvate/2-oxoglutarate dehydrogenase complex dihydrolipoamide acyltransferase (E2) component